MIKSDDVTDVVTRTQRLIMRVDTAAMRDVTSRFVTPIVILLRHYSR